MTSEQTSKAASAMGDIFAPTRWTVVLAAGRARSAQSDAALAELCRTYWYPLYVYVRRHCSTREDAEDLTQGFFARLLEKNYFSDLAPDRGRAEQVKHGDGAAPGPFCAPPDPGRQTLRCGHGHPRWETSSG